DQVLSTAHAYALFQTASRASGAAYRAAAEPGQTVSVDALIQAVEPATRIVAVANPGNPTGTRISNTEIRRLRDGLPEDVLLIVDEAYGEFADHLDAPVFDLAERGDTVVLRTFSKAYALAGQRIGWGVMPEAIASDVRKLMNPNNVSAVSQAMAAAAMADQPYMQGIVRRTTDERTRFCEALDGLDLAPVSSDTNFALIPFADAAEAGSADQVLRKRGVLMRGVAGYGLAHCLRATIGRPDQMDAAIAALRAWRGRDL
ncbi:MAG: histidinol-phosphate transaminase, partial [Pseudomonadota bacterium]